MARTRNTKSLRNLAQYKNLTDEEFAEIMDQRSMGIEMNTSFEERVTKKLASFEEDYDLSDMKFNDSQTLRALAQAMITLDDFEIYMYSLRMKGISDENLNIMDKVGRYMSQLRSDISKMQDDLKITRKVRKGDKEESVINEIETLKKKAAEFYEARMSYIYCPECHMLLGTFWALYPDANNSIELVCQRKYDDGSYCNTRFTVTTKDLMENRGTNAPELMPESML